MTTEIQTTTLPQIDPLALIAKSDKAASTKTKYTKSLVRYMEVGNLADSEAVIAYADTLSDSAKGIFKAALGLWQNAMLTSLKALSRPETVDDLRAVTNRFEATREGIVTKGRAKGQKAHTWLSKVQVRELLDKPDTTDLLGLRDKVVLGLAVGLGLRRSEIAGARWQDIVTQPGTGKVLQVLGKGKRNRVVPIPTWLQPILTDWQSCNGKIGYIARSVNRHGALGESLSDVSVFRIIAGYGAAIDFPLLAAHDLRRTFAQQVYEKTHDLVACQKLLGHSSIETTRLYLEVDAASLRDAVEWLD